MPVNGQSDENTLAARHPAIPTGPLPVTGIAAYISRFAILVLLAAPIMYVGPRWDILLTGGLWFAFSIYWSIAG